MKVVNRNSSRMIATMPLPPTSLGTDIPVNEKSPYAQGASKEVSSILPTEDIPYVIQTAPENPPVETRDNYY